MVATAGGPGSLIGARLGEYEVEALIGRGAMGSVYLARDTKLNRLVALKVLLGSLARTPSLVKQFHQEAQAAAPLKHPGIVRIYSAGTEGGTPYIAMEFVDGEPLDRFLKRRGKVSWQVALHIGAKLAQALDCAHRGRVIHRDVKPSNVMLDRKGNVRLTDFGIASIQSDGQAASPGAPVLGTPQYMSPEQVTGGDIGPSTDLFALGVMLYQMISGEMPFRGETSIALIKSISEDTPPRLNTLDPSIPDDVARLVAYLIEKKPGSRPANSKVVYGLIHRLLKQRGGESVVSQSLSVFLKEETEPRPFSRLHASGGRTWVSESGIRKKVSWAGSSFAWRRLAQTAAIVVIASAGFAVGPLTSILARESHVGRAPVMELASFSSIGPGAKRLDVFADGYELGRVSWLGDKPIALLEVRGMRGSLTQDLKGLLAVDPEEEEVLSLRPPADITEARNMFTRRTPGSFTIDIPRTPEDAPLADSFLVHARGSGAWPIITLAQRWDSPAPKVDVLFRATEQQWFKPGSSQWGASPVSSVVLSPNGKTLCMLLYDEELGYGYLVERDVGDTPRQRTGERRTTSGGEIVPESIQYSPNGSKIAYVRRTLHGEFELFLLPSRGVEQNGKRIAEGLTSEVFAFSPDGQRVAVLMRGPGFDTPEICLFDVSFREIVARFGPGTLSREAWHPSGRYFTFVAETLEASQPYLVGPSRQLFAALAVAPYTMKQVTHANTGVSGSYALSRDGRWVAAIVAGAKVPGLLLFELGAFGVELGTGTM